MTIVVVGAGPAGLSAAQAASALGKHVLLVDSSPSVGGQYFRQPYDQPLTLPGVEHLPSTVVWTVEGRRVHLLTGPADGPGRQGQAVDASALILATGAYDRVIPFAGWDSPKVFTAGAAQALAKGQRVAVGKRVLVGGTGPFLFAVTKSLVSVGAEIVGVLEANFPTWRDPWAARHKLGELAGYAAFFARHRIPYRLRTAVTAVRDGVTTVSRLDADWNVRDSKDIEVDAVCVGYGFTPQLELAVAAGCELTEGFVRVDISQQTSVPGVFAAGEITGIGGADLAAAEGAVAGVAAAGGTIPRSARKRVRDGRRFAAALAGAYPLKPGWRTWLDDETIVCRCERVPVGQLRAAITDRQLTGARAVRLASRVGLGLCQGRICSRNVADLTGIPFTDRRPVAAPVRLGELEEAP